MVILDKANTLSERIFYLKEAIRNGWNRNILKVNIESRLHERYVNIIDDKIKLPVHNPTIGVLFCKTPNDMVVKYSLQGIQTPLGVAEYELMPTQLKAEMPTVEELEQELGRDIESMIKPIEEKNNSSM